MHQGRRDSLQKLIGVRKGSYLAQSVEVAFVRMEVLRPPVVWEWDYITQIPFPVRPFTQTTSWISNRIQASFSVNFNPQNRNSEAQLPEANEFPHSSLSICFRYVHEKAMMLMTSMTPALSERLTVAITFTFSGNNGNDARRTEYSTD